MAPRCGTCGTTDNVAAYGLCGPCRTTARVAERQAQGLPATVTDPRALEPIATVLAHADQPDISAA